MWQISLGAAYGEFRTSHIAECPDVAPECAVAIIPPHEHRARLGLYRGDLSVGYGVKAGLLLSLRVPYEVKDQRIDYRTLEGEPFDPPYGDIHHRTERLDGFGDGELGLSLVPARDFLVGAGITLPFGRTEEDPIDLGRRGLKHEHIQFGSGTVDPTLAVQWSRPFGRLSLAASANARIPLYENRHGFQAPITVRWSLGPKVVVAGAGCLRPLFRPVPVDRKVERRSRRGNGLPQRRSRSAELLPSRARVEAHAGRLPRDLLREPLGRVVPAGDDLVGRPQPVPVELTPRQKRRSTTTVAGADRFPASSTATTWTVCSEPRVP